MKELFASSRLDLGGYLAVGALLLGVSCRPPQTPRTPAVIEPEPDEPLIEYVTSQEILTPLPLRVRLPARYRAERVLVFFNTWGSARWGALELARAGQTWTGEVSCREVSTITGDTRYFFVAVDTEGREVIGNGGPAWPHVATVVGQLPGGPRGLAGMPPPLRCDDPADCPPDFPGCPAYVVRRPACRHDRECDDGSGCDWDGYCRDVSGGTAQEASDPRLAADVQEALRRGGKKPATHDASSP